MANTRKWRLAAMLLLLFAAADVLVPGLCVADSEQPRVAQSRSGGEGRVDDADLDSRHADCFCCCPHIIPGLRQNLAAQYSAVAGVADTPTGLVELSPVPLYHPPRTPQS